ncbi:MAG: 30S ribosomal protein S12 methylthiotransferase RimO [Lachnospiraceae bacterium]|nr:30S ribosomal protein S12 methylthiotransferase RimO [Lachnospiraceae bacterium]
MKIIFVSLGCDKNLVDAQQMMGLLKNSRGSYTFTDDETEAEAAVVNTCCFIDRAKQESIDEILSLVEWKKQGNLKYLIVTGCMAQRYREEITTLIPEVDVVVGTTAEKHLGEILDRLTGAAEGDEPVNKLYTESLKETTGAPAKRLITADSHIGYLKIAEGCNKCCTYCVIPSVRGRYRSVPMEDILADARDLIEQGARELILVAQETTIYGVDLYGKKMLPELLRRLCLLSGVKWIRVLYCYPEEITEEILQVMHDEEKILPYLDIPIQHASDRILKRMGRRTDQKELREKIAMIRRILPDVCLRTTLITGFPGETEEEHKELLSFIEEMRFDRLGVFTYSREEGTPAAKLPGQIHHMTKKRRQRELMTAQQPIAFAAAEAMKGQVLDVLIEGKLTGEDVYVGRTYKDIPGVDSNIFIETRRDLLTGEFVRAKVTGANEYDLIGELV